MAAVEDYEVKVIEKPAATRKLLMDSISASVLFRSCDPGDMEALVDSFEPRDVVSGDTVIKQGDQGDDFFVVESGLLRVFVVFTGRDEEAEVRTPYKSGESFGELALMYNNARAATVRAAADCRFVTFAAAGSHALGDRSFEMRQRLELLGLVKVGDKSLKDALSRSELLQLAEAMEPETFAKEAMRQGEAGDAFYIVECGEVTVYKNDGKDPDNANGLGEVVHHYKTGDYFGERALLSEEKRAASCVAATDGTVCLTLNRGDFDRMLGSHFVDIRVEDIEVIRTLGAGAFGNVKLIKHKPTSVGYALKCQAKRGILDNDLQSHVLEERKLLMELDHPFILKLHNSFQDNFFVYFVIELLVGGELFSHLRRLGRLQEAEARFYAASVLHAFDYIHTRKIAYRDLKPENLVLDATGYIKIVDFGLAKVIPSGLTWTICGTPDYLAPEIILNEGHDSAVDYWALGVLMFEMVAGTPPFYADDPMATYEKILGNNLHIPDYFSKNLRDILHKLLKSNKTKRLGKTRGGAGAVMKHKWYSGFNWDALMAKELTPPIQPDIKDPLDPANYDPGMANLEDPEAVACPEWVPDF
ncbi:cGMP-dependent protein kinase [Tribonema minus]|uniref:cGMP-dependent protein kinase n=1 Tax=Tribonema minus TaxID=303371 RepID=A0A835YTZ8_9STRA|nr:cGMP-dependent protein kinase [Tribonema minus]